MTTRLIAKRVEIREGTPLTLVARIETAGGTPVTSASFDSVVVEAFDESSTTPDTAVWSSGGLDPTTVYSDTLIYDDAANTLGDSGGRNFKYVLAIDDFRLLGGRTYTVQVHSYQGSSDFVDVYSAVVHEVRGG
jgi:hypothetical protein